MQWARRGPRDRRVWLSLVPYALIALAGGIALLSSVPGEMRTPSLLFRAIHAPRALCFYVRTFFWPRGLLTMYPRWPPDPTGFADLTAWIGLVATAGVCLALRDRLPRTVAFGLGLFLVNVALVIGLVWFTYLDRAPVADHLVVRMPDTTIASCSQCKDGCDLSSENSTTNAILQRQYNLSASYAPTTSLPGWSSPTTAQMMPVTDNAR